VDGFSLKLCQGFVVVANLPPVHGRALRRWISAFH
jgi:hypothetical protein